MFYGYVITLGLSQDMKISFLDTRKGKKDQTKVKKAF